MLLLVGAHLGHEIRYAPMVPLFLLGVLILSMSGSAAVAYTAPDASIEPESGQPVDYVYHNYTNVKDTLYSVQAQHPSIAKVYDIGDSWEKTNGTADRDILAIKISDNVASEEDEPETLIMALHHAREWPTTEIALALIENLTDGYGSNKTVSWLVDNRETWIIPVVNPDGLDFALSSDDNWRKNRHYFPATDSYGVDLNRNYNGSANDDPLGAWGGAGTSDDPTSDVYCGEYAFSEPEILAVRDLIRAHDFQIGVDFHTYGEWVMWPWGYTTDLTADDDDLVRIGNEFAALNGYLAAQSVVMYATTGDSVDWMYGGADIYSYCIEAGTNLDQFHPSLESDVVRIIGENVPVALLAIDLSGDRNEKAFDISHAPASSRDYSASGFEITADITADRGVDTSALAVMYSVDGGGWESVPMVQTGVNDTYAGTIPAQSAGSSVDYYIVAHDLGGVELMAPQRAPYDVYTFTVNAVDGTPVADAGLPVSTSIGGTVVFDGSGSVDDGAIASYVWKFTYNGSEVTLTGVSPSFRFWTAGVYVVTLNVTDSSGNWAIDTVSATVEPTAIPEFGQVLVPVASVLAVFLLVGLRGRSKKR